jgi:D-amino-acid dehydrogenase
VLLVDRAGPGRGASFGNAGIIKREAVQPYAFPRAPRKLAAALARRGADISYHAAALPRTAGTLLRYWWHSAPARHRRIAAAYAGLIARSLDEHGRLVALAGAEALIRKDGWLDACRTSAALVESAAFAEANARDYGVQTRVLDGAGLARLEPHLLEPMKGAIHWTDTWTVRDPGALVEAHARAFVASGGQLVPGEVRGLARDGAGWRLDLATGPLRTEAVVLAAGAWSTRALGYPLPLFVKRGYHMQYARTRPGRSATGLPTSRQATSSLR